MQKLIASTFVGGGSLWLYLDDQLISRNRGVATLEVSDGTGYIISWFVKGVAGDTYSITISSPREAEYQLTRTLDASGKDQGSFRFVTRARRAA